MTIVKKENLIDQIPQTADGDQDDIQKPYVETEYNYRPYTQVPCLVDDPSINAAEIAFHDDEIRKSQALFGEKLSVGNLDQITNKFLNL